MIRCSLFYTAHRTMKILNVAEKNDAAKNIAFYLSGGKSRMRQGFSKYNKIYEFPSQISGVNCEMIMTSVSGHLLNYDFSSISRSWTSCSPASLFEAPIIRFCPKEYEDIKRTLEREIRGCSKLIIWTDCDREGENIGFEVIEVCTNIKRNIEIHRAKFSEITAASIQRALRTLERPNENVNVAVNVRRELDLRIGAAFTRFQTLHLKNAFPEALGTSLVSYGSCQFPTLGFVVERFKDIADFISEKFWKITVVHAKDDKSVEFIWERNKLFMKLPCEVLYDTCIEDGKAKVLSVESKPKLKWRPRPLDTVELEKLASRKLKLTAKETMKIAEKLYTLGFISYPRTETNIFPKEMNLKPLVQNFVEDPLYGVFAAKVLRDGPNPFQGSKSDQAHPPIHPIKYTTQLSGSEHRLYDFVVRRFLACLSKHAEGLETIVKIDIASEKFTGKGLMIIARNYLEIYPFEKWSDKEIPTYEVGEEFFPEINMDEGETSPPSLLTEADLIALMEKHGIGTDATHAEHIETIKARLYVGLSDQYFVPRTLGMGLVEGYDNMGFEMSKPHLRAELEKDLSRICEGAKDGKTVLDTHVQKYKEIFLSTQTQVEKLNSAIEKYFNVESQTYSAETNYDRIEKVKPCPNCGGDLVLRSKKSNDGKYIGCTGYPQCKEAIFFPGFVQKVEPTPDPCQECGPRTFPLKFKFERNSCFLPSNYTGCLTCDPCLDSVTERKSGNGGPREPRNYNPTLNFPSPAPSFTGQIFSNRNSTNTFGIAGQRNYSSFSSSENVCCSCGTPAKRSTVKNKGPNHGKEFYRCGSKRLWDRCEFFQWVDDENSSSQRDAPARSETSSYDPSGMSEGNENVVCCSCGTPAKRLTVKKEGPNQGKEFYGCGSKRLWDRCEFFQWVDDENSSSQRYVPASCETSSDDPSGMSEGNENVVCCSCGTPAKRLTVKKEGPNQGREFYRCGSKRLWDRCEFFQWVDDENSFSQRDVPASCETSSDDPSGMSEGNENVVCCSCGTPAKRLTVKKEGPNQGKEFYGCGSKRQWDRCDFFQWVDDENSFSQRDVPASCETSSDDPSGMSEGNENVVCCSCGTPAKRLTVKKEGPNQGKEFYGCGSKRQWDRCDFFQWVDDKNSSSQRDAPARSETSSDDPSGMSEGNENKKNANCFCGIPSKSYEVLKEGPNKGRIFIACEKVLRDPTRCDFFKWKSNSTSFKGARDGGGFGSQAGKAFFGMEYETDGEREDFTEKEK